MSNTIKNNTMIGLILILILNISDVFMVAYRKTTEATTRNKGNRNSHFDGGFLLSFILCLIYCHLLFLQERRLQLRK